MARRPTDLELSHRPGEKERPTWRAVEARSKGLPEELPRPASL